MSLRWFGSIEPDGYDRCLQCGDFFAEDGLCSDCEASYYEDHPSFTDADRNEGAYFIGPH